MNFSLVRSTEILSRTPTALAELLRDVDDAWTRSNEGEHTFSAFDVIGHLIDGEETDWIPRAKLILAQGKNRTFEPYDRFRHIRRNKGRTLPSLLDEFATCRDTSLAQLAAWRLTDRHLDLTGDHPRLGHVTLRQLLSAWVVHDLGHIAQVARVMAKQYTEAVGPWVQFLPVLTDHLKPRS
jgi:hypothetical protein